MTIAVDLDDTVVNSVKTVKEIIERDPNISSYEEYLNFSEEEYIRFQRKYLNEVVSNSPLNPYCFYVLNEIKKLGHSLIVITARSNDYRDDILSLTDEYIKRYNLPFDEVITCCTWKSETCIKKSVDLMLDDNKYVCKDLVAHNIPVLMHYTLINRDCDIPCFYSWLDALEYIKKIGGE